MLPFRKSLSRIITKAGQTLILVRRAGLEPARLRSQGILSPSCLPIPPPPHNFKTAFKLILSQSRHHCANSFLEEYRIRTCRKKILLLLSFILVGQEGVEPSSSGSSDQRSDRISYQPAYIYNLFFFSYNLYA